MPQDDLLSRARALLGVPFRLHGRSEETGLDCVGLIAVATGAVRGVPTGYALRNADEARWVSLLDALGGRVLAEAVPAGSVLLMRPGHAQYHLGIWSGQSLIHADTRLRRVVERPGAPPWPVIGAWVFQKG